MTITYCKFCRKDIPVPQYGRDYECIHCFKYKVGYNHELGQGFSLTETLVVENYHLIFFPYYKEANVVESANEGGFKKLNTFALEELTHELAVQWVEKLKVYCLFQ